MIKLLCSTQVPGFSILILGDKHLFWCVVGGEWISKY